MQYESLTDAELKEALLLKERLKTLDMREGAQSKFLNFINATWPEFICGRHHKIFAQKLEDIATGKINRLIVNMPPRHTKSEFASTYFPAWIMGKFPNKKIMQTTRS